MLQRREPIPAAARPTPCNPYTEEGILRIARCFPEAHPSRTTGTDGCPQTRVAHRRSLQALQHTPEGCSQGKRASLQARTLMCVYYKNQESKTRDFASHLRKHLTCSAHSVTHSQVPAAERMQTLASETGPFPGTKGVGMPRAALGTCVLQHQELAEAASITCKGCLEHRLTCLQHCQVLQVEVSYAFYLARFGNS